MCSLFLGACSSTQQAKVTPTKVEVVAPVKKELAIAEVVEIHTQVCTGLPWDDSSAEKEALGLFFNDYCAKSKPHPATVKAWLQSLESTYTWSGEVKAYFSLLKRHLDNLSQMWVERRQKEKELQHTIDSFMAIEKKLNGAGG